MVDLLPANIDTYWFVSAQLWRHDVVECVAIYRDEEIRNNEDWKYYREPQRKDLYVSEFTDLGELFTYQSVLIIAGAILLIVGLHVLINRKTIIRSSKDNSNNNNKNRMKKMTRYFHKNSPTITPPTTSKNGDDDDVPNKANTTTNQQDQEMIIKNNNTVPNTNWPLSDTVPFSSTGNFPYKSDFMKELELATITKDRF